MRPTLPDTVDFETRKAIGRTRIRGKWQDDYVRDDSALVYRGEEFCSRERFYI